MTSRERDIGRSYLSGSAKRKGKKKKLKERKVVSKILKLTTFFQKQPSDTDTPEPPSHLPTADEILVELEGNNISNGAEINSPPKG